MAVLKNQDFFGWDLFKPRFSAEDDVVRSDKLRSRPQLRARSSGDWYLVDDTPDDGTPLLRRLLTLRASS